MYKMRSILTRRFYAAKAKKAKDPGSDNQELKSIVMPTFPTAPRPSESDAFIETTFERDRQARFLQKKEELERMYKAMADACIELERVSPSLFKRKRERRKNCRKATILVTKLALVFVSAFSKLFEVLYFSTFCSHFKMS